MLVSPAQVTLVTLHSTVQTVNYLSLCICVQMESELERFNKQNTQLELNITELRQKLKATDKEMHQERQKVRCMRQHYDLLVRMPPMARWQEMNQVEDVAVGSCTVTCPSLKYTSFLLGR